MGELGVNLILMSGSGTLLVTLAAASPPTRVGLFSKA